MRLILGTAEFSQKPYGEGVVNPPDTKEIIRILNLAWEAGIDTLDCSDSYGYGDLIDRHAINFRKIHKTRIVGGGYYHYQPGETKVDTKLASVYDKAQLDGLESVIVPISINNSDFVNCSVKHRIARSIFDRGRLLKEYTVEDCIRYIKRQKVHGAIVGVNSERELEEILKVWGDTR